MGAKDLLRCTVAAEFRLTPELASDSCVVFSREEGSARLADLCVLVKENS